MAQVSDTRIQGGPTNEAIRSAVYVENGSMENMCDKLRTLFNQGAPGNTCGVCNWTNVGCLNVGESGAPEWVCHGCLKRERDAAMREASTLAASLYKANYQEEAPEWKMLLDVAGIISQIDNMVAGLRQRRDQDVAVAQKQFREALVERDEARRSAAAWEETAAQFARNAEFYQGLVVKIGEPFGVAARTSDDGSVQQDVLALKVPELVDRLRELAELTITKIEQSSNHRGWRGLKLWERALLSCAYYALGRKAPH